MLVFYFLLCFAVDIYGNVQVFRNSSAQGAVKKVS